jgi:DNA-binding transcriptional MerR regulator
MSEFIEIPNKSLFKVNEVCSLTGVKSYVLRFWESEFDEISPVVSSSGQKMYEHKDIEAILQIKKLLFDDKLSIEKAKADMKTMSGAVNTVVSQESSDVEPEAEIAVAPSSKRALSDVELEKMAKAKSKLSSMLSLADSIKQNHNWS